ncbi:hypothetical protein KY290_030993 [Solanum tuberosum]|uniref:Uncharacterized protein n=1 Tax=Solanum tuberosum TaxID=4113 RepID=A0ABQ7UBD5_SOLTU|nr:hypothetical protein KY290_030993 [Solanum tuberosum]
MFRKYGNQFIFKDIVFMDDELAFIEAKNLSVLIDLAFNKKRECDRFVHNDLKKFEKNVDAKFVGMKAFMDSAFKHIIEELKSLQNDVSTNKDLCVERITEFNM